MFLKHVAIHQIRSIEHVALDFSSESAAGPATTRQRTVLIGQTACGKSNALRAIALVLAGGDALGGLQGDAASWVRNGQKEGHISALLATEKGAPIEVNLTLKTGWSPRQTVSKNEVGMRALDAALKQSASRFFTLGYGVSRRPAYPNALAGPAARAAASGNAQAAPSRLSAVASLFSPEAALVPFAPWVAGLEAASGKAALRTLLKALVPGLVLAGVDARTHQALFQTPDGQVPFEQLSEASQTLINWCADVLYRIHQTFGSNQLPLKAAGVLLVDELDLHLHPLAQRTVLEALALALPNLQIIATSQSPMLAQQAREGELVVLERAAASRGATARVAQGDPSQLTLGQLMAPYFGVDTVDSARVAALRSRARSSPGLLAARDHLELASLSPIQELPVAMQAQLQATTELTEAVARSSGQTTPKLDPAKLRQKMGERIKSAALRAGGGS